ncbi:fused MFS/spermidine synthase [candidate division KSB1 bacterium]|nr:fused MFS/spermidine synthase [candidate division KSB1 bacterium]
MKKFLLYFIVSISGASILAIEILGTRILGPFYGVSLFLWSALITVTLAALSLGYFIGGYWADRKASYPRLCLILGSAGIWVMLIPFIKQPLLFITEPLGIRFAVLIAAFILFFPPLTLLGTVSPYAIKLNTARLAEVGRSVGNLYAVSTLSSVLSALLTGFFLIPNVGVRLLTICIGMLLILTAAAGFVSIRRSRMAALIGISVILFIGGFYSISQYRLTGMPEGLLHLEQSPYAEIRVLDEDDRRYLLIDGGIHSLIIKSEWKSLHRHVAVMEMNKYFFEKAGNMLLIGLGGGSIVQQFSNDGWTVDAVEIDPVVVKVAHQFFRLNPRTCTVFQQDGRQFLMTHQKLYELIIMDAFGSSSIPFHLITREAFGLIASRLQPDGIFAINVEALGWRDPMVNSIAATLKTHFAEVMVLPVNEPPNTLGNIVLLASNRKLIFPEELLIHPVEYAGLDPYLHWLTVQQNHAWDNRFVPALKNAAVLTDDLNPVDIQAEAVNRVARQELHEFFGRSKLSW